MKPIASPRVVEETAVLLAAEPGLSNAQLLRRLAARLGDEALAGILVTRFQRQVRDPAVHLLRQRMRNGAGVIPEAPKGTVASEEAPRTEHERTTHERASGKGPARKPDPSAERPGRAEDHQPRPERVEDRRAPRARVRGRRARPSDDDLLQAFRLGAEAETTVDIIAAYREFEKLRSGIRQSARRRPTSDGSALDR